MNNTYDNSTYIPNNHIVWNAWTVVTLIICIAIPLIVGAISSFLTQDAMMSFESMNKPPLAPPGWLFPVAWTILYILMGVASFLIYKSNSEARYMGLLIYMVQLVFNFVWSLIFFKYESYWFAAVWLAVLLVMIIALMMNTSKYSLAAMFMLLPYAAWCCFAMYLNVGIAMRN